VAFNVAANQTYYIQIDGVNGATGTVYLNYSLNTAPTISAISAVASTQNAGATSRSFTIGDRETGAGSLQLSVASSNPTLVPTGNITFSGTDGNRSIAIQPAANQTGSATITVTVRDAGGLTASTGFSVTVSSANRAPVANSDSTSCKKGSTVSLYIPSLLSNDSDPDGDPLSFYSYTSTSNLSGKITQSGNYLYYTPSSTVGTGSSDYFTYTITDGRGGYASARVFISITQ
jgi:hypothetical protein